MTVSQSTDSEFWDSGKTLRALADGSYFAEEEENGEVSLSRSN